MQWLHLYPHVANSMLPADVFKVHMLPSGVAERFCSWISIHHVCHVCHCLFVIVALYILYGQTWLLALLLHHRLIHHGPPLWLSVFR